jgi:hypothetical protein
MPACGFIKASGEACKAIPMKGEGWCYVHHPHYKEQRQRDGSKGGRRGGRGRPQAELAAIKSKLEDLAEDVLSGSVDRSDAAVVAQIYNTVIRAVGVELKVREQQDILERMEELETVLERQNARTVHGT